MPSPQQVRDKSAASPRLRGGYEETCLMDFAKAYVHVVRYMRRPTLRFNCALQKYLLRGFVGALEYFQTNTIRYNFR